MAFDGARSKVSASNSVRVMVVAMALAIQCGSALGLLPPQVINGVSGAVGGLVPFRAGLAAATAAGVAGGAGGSVAGQKLGCPSGSIDAKQVIAQGIIGGVAGGAGFGATALAMPGGSAALTGTIAGGAAQTWANLGVLAAYGGFLPGP